MLFSANHKSEKQNFHSFYKNLSYTVHLRHGPYSEKYFILIPMDVMGLVTIVTLEEVDAPGLTTTTGVPELVGSCDGLGRILLPPDPGKLWVIIFIPAMRQNFNVCSTLQVLH